METIEGLLTVVLSDHVLTTRTTAMLDIALRALLYINKISL
jgi:hypothetical protein